MSKIVDNASAKNLLEQIQTVESLEALYRAVPFAKRLFPSISETFEQFQEIKKQAKILLVPDQFNEAFSDIGWIAYESMNLDAMTSAIEIKKQEGLAAAELFLADYYNEETLKWAIMRFNGHPEFRRRIRLIELAKDDYLAGRFHACVPLLLALIDGLVNDVTKHVGFFAEGSDMTAWDSIAAHETGLTALAKIMRLGRNKTNSDPISIPFRNGILHGRELAFDNQIVAAKCWAALFAVRDWVSVLSKGKAEPRVKEKESWKELVQQITKTSKLRKALEKWKPRQASDLSYLPHSNQPASSLPAETPERAVAEFLDNWCKSRFGLMADVLLEFTGTPRGKKAGRAKQDFGRTIPHSYSIVGVTDEAAAISQVDAELFIQGSEGLIAIRVSVRTVYNDAENHPAMRSCKGGNWRIVQNSLSKVIYGPPVSEECSK